MTLASVLVERARRELLAGTNEPANKLATTVNSSVTSWSFTYDLNFNPGNVLECEAEQVYVWSTNTAAKTAEVERAWNGTTAAAHTAPLVVGVGPRFGRQSLLDSVNFELVDYTANCLFRMRTLDVAYAADGLIVPLAFTDTPLSIYEVRIQRATRDWRLIPASDWELVRDQLPADFSSGYGLRLFRSYWAEDLRILYRAPFGTVAALSDDLAGATIGWPVEGSDLMALGLQLRAMAPREVKRNFTESQGDTRRGQEVPPGAVDSSYRGVERLRQARLISEVNRLHKRYPARTR